MVAGNESGIPVFIPSCNENGSYKQVQCHEGRLELIKFVKKYLKMKYVSKCRFCSPGTGYCWCVDDQGRPVPGSSVRNSKPLCHLLNVTGRWRRGKHKSRDRSKGRVKGRKKDVCTQADRFVL